MDSKSYLDAIQIGRILLANTVFPYLEAFSENVLYCDRGIPPMNKYKTVKEVCDLTGLTRKHLYYFHHEKVVQAVAYANYSVYGYDGYKLYDDAAVEKLQQIALYYQLGLKRDEIRDIMLDPNYDSNLVLDTLLAIARTKRATIERHIAALEYLKLTGVKNRLLSPLRGVSLNELGQTVLNMQNIPQTDRHFTMLSEAQINTFSRELTGLFDTLQRLDLSQINDQPGTKIIHKIFDLAAKYMGADGCPFILGLLVSTTGEGSAFLKLNEKISPIHSKAIIRYLTQHPELYTSSLQDIPL